MPDIKVNPKIMKVHNDLMESAKLLYALKGENVSHYIKAIEDSALAMIDGAPKSNELKKRVMQLPKKVNLYYLSRRFLRGVGTEEYLKNCLGFKQCDGIGYPDYPALVVSPEHSELEAEVDVWGDFLIHNKKNGQFLQVYPTSRGDLIQLVDFITST